MKLFYMLLLLVGSAVAVSDKDLLAGCADLQKKKHLVYMMITEESDTRYLPNLKMHDNLIYVSENASHCPSRGCCITLRTGYGYETLDLKVKLVMQTLMRLFPSFTTLSKLDDDAFLDYYAFESLQPNLTSYSYAGKFIHGGCSESAVDFAGGSFYTLGRSLIECSTKDYYTCGSGYEDRAVAISIYRNCDHYDRLDLTSWMNVELFHKVYAHKDKLLYLDNKDANATRFMPDHGSKVNLTTPILDEKDRAKSPS
jgi:hypothetical protein